jgi:beta-lactamase regulating signal transducer with metallopeptidase domain
VIKWIVTASILMVIIALRHFPKGKISLRLQSALWGLVLLRLLIPFSIGSSGWSVMNTVTKIPVVQDFESVGDIGDIWHTGSGSVEGDPPYEPMPEMSVTAAENKTGAEYARMEKALAFREAFIIIWLCGAAILFIAFAASNGQFSSRLRRIRRWLEVKDSTLPVYSSSELDTPCLFGLFCPAIYVTSESAEDAAIRRIGEAERAEYGRTLIGRTYPRRTSLLIAATTMTGGKRSIKERIMRIAKKAKRLIPAVIAVAAVAVVAAGCTFTGAKGEQAEIIPLTADEMGAYNKAFEPLLYDEQGNPTDVNPINQFLSSYYDRPEDINLAELLRYFPSDSDVTDKTEFEALKDSENWPFGTDMTLADMPVPIHKFSDGTVNQALEEYMGITLDDLSGVGMDELIYLKGYDAYYNFTSDAGFVSFTCTSGERQGDLVRLFGETETLTLKIQGDGFWIVSHQRTGNASGDSADQA